MADLLSALPPLAADVEVISEDLEHNMQRILFGFRGDSEFLASIIVTSAGSHLRFENGVSADFDSYRDSLGVVRGEVKELVRAISVLNEVGYTETLWRLGRHVTARAVTLAGDVGGGNPKTWVQGWQVGRKHGPNQVPSWTQRVGRDRG